MTTFTSWDAELYHHGVKGQKWSIRRFQNADGTLTAEGKARYGEDGNATAKQRARFLNKLDRQNAKSLASMQDTKNVYKKQRLEGRVSNVNKAINDILAASEKKGIRLSSKSATRYVMTGKDVTKAIVGTVAGTVLISTLPQLKIAGARILPGIAGGGIVATARHKVQGTYYKADKNKHG